MEKLVDDENFSNLLLFLLLTGYIWSPIKNPSHDTDLSSIRTNEH